MSWVCVVRMPVVLGTALSMPFHFPLSCKNKRSSGPSLSLVLRVEYGQGEKESGMRGLGKLLTDSFLAHLSPEAWVEKPSFGKPLEEHLMISGREIAFPIEACVTMLLECGMQEEVGTKQPCPSPSWPILSRGRVLKSIPHP